MYQWIPSLTINPSTSSQNFTESKTFTWKTCQRKPNSIHVSYYWEFIRTPLFTWVQMWSVFRFVQLCCNFKVNAFTSWNKRVGAYLGNYLSTFICGLMFIRIDPNLHIVSRWIKLIRTNIYKVLQFIVVNLPKWGLNWRDPTYFLII